MNNTFAFNRFKNLLLKDGKMYIHNFGTELLVFCCFPAMFWIVNLIFGGSTPEGARFGLICVMVALAMLQAPSKVYGKVNLSREGVGFAMMPTSSLEKFVSMFIYCAIVTPVVAFFGGYLIDAFLSIFPFGGFEKPIHLYSLNELVSMMNDSEGVIQAGGETEFSINDVFPIGVIRTGIYVGIIQWAAICMLGNMLFKKHKAGKTFACYLGISYLLSTVFGGIMFANPDRIDQWWQSIKNLSDVEMIHLWQNVMAWSLVFSIIVTIVLLFFTYRKIQTQKY